MNVKIILLIKNLQMDSDKNVDTNFGKNGDFIKFLHPGFFQILCFMSLNKILWF